MYEFVGDWGMRYKEVVFIIIYFFENSGNIGLQLKLNKISRCICIYINGPARVENTFRLCSINKMEEVNHKLLTNNIIAMERTNLTTKGNFTRPTKNMYKALNQF